jgi:uncharacterized protein (DUF488 family)
LLSIGHSNLETEALIRLLEAASVTALADVRSQPFSKRHPQFNQPELQSLLSRGDIAYAFLGDSLGGRPRARHFYDDEGRISYERVRVTPGFARGLDLLIQGAEDHIVAFLCSEEDPLDCHRGLMITPALVERGLSPGHLRKDGTVEPTPAMEQRLLEATSLDGGMLGGLFADLVSAEERREILAEAYRERGRRKGYRLPSEGEEP